MQHPISYFGSLAGAQEKHKNSSVGSECAALCRCHHTLLGGQASSVLEAVYQQQCSSATYLWHLSHHRVC